MNRNQWFVFGAGLILLFFFISYTSGLSNKTCSDLVNYSATTKTQASELGLDIQDVETLGMDAWVISCLDMNIYISLISTMIFTLGIIFVVLGFLEPKNKQ